MQIECVNQNGRELFVGTFANVRDKPPTLPDGDLTGGRTVPESRRGARDSYLIRRQHRGTELSSMRRPTQLLLPYHSQRDHASIVAKTGQQPRIGLSGY